MSTKNLNFKSMEIQEDFDKLCDTYLSYIITCICQKYPECIIDKINFEKLSIKVFLKSNTQNITITSNYKEMKTYVASDTWNYQIIYDNHPHNLFTEMGYLYHETNKTLFKKNIKDSDSENNEQKYSYIYQINNQKYIINILSYDKLFNENELLKYLLQKFILNIKNINELFTIIINSNDITNIKLDIVHQNNQDQLLIDKGNIIKYHLTYKEDGKICELYLENNKFYKKESIIEEVEDEVYVKKIGGKYGQRKEN